MTPVIFGTESYWEVDKLILVTHNGTHIDALTLGDWVRENTTDNFNFLGPMEILFHSEDDANRFKGTFC